MKSTMFLITDYFSVSVGIVFVKNDMRVYILLEFWF